MKRKLQPQSPPESSSTLEQIRFLVIGHQSGDRSDATLIRAIHHLLAQRLEYWTLKTAVKKLMGP